jgi:hexulose-6-phosphate isomerase
MLDHHNEKPSESFYLSRREMIHRVAATGLALSGVTFSNKNAFSRGGKQITPHRKPIFKSLKFGMIKEKLSILDKFKLVQDIGYDGVELDSPGGQNKKECLEASQKTGLPIHGVVDSRHWRVRATESAPRRRAECLKDLLTAIKESHYCGGSSVLFVPGHGEDGSKNEIVPRAIEVIQQALPTAAKLGMKILIENVWNKMFYDHDEKPEQTADQYATFIDDCNSPWVGAYFDIGNHHKYGQPQDWIRTLGKRIVKLDVKDFNRDKNEWSDIGDGTINWPVVRETLDEIGFTGWCTAEVSGGNRKRLADILTRMNRVLPD